MDTSSTDAVGETWQYDPDYHRTADYMGIDAHERDDVRVAQKVSVLRDWAKENGAENLEDALGRIHDLRRNLGTQSHGKALINELYQHLRFQSKSPQKTKGVKKASPKQSKPKTDPLSKVVQQSVEGRIADIVRKTMMDKNIIYKAVDQVVKGAFK